MNTVNVSLDTFSMLSVIGKGSYAKVMLARKIGSQSVYAIKILKKKHIQKTKQEANIMTERNVLTRVEHPFIVRLHWSFQNDQKLFFVLDYCPGGQLFGLLEKKSRLTEEQARFYAAQLVLALQYLHSQDILYRDLKPQNVLIDRNGYIKLTDFGLSRIKIIADDVTVCGTPEYLAPEIVKKAGHSKEVDWWCLGCLLYEMVAGFPPFTSKNRSQLFSKIVEDEPKLPNFISAKMRNLLQGLLNKNPQNRLGAKSDSDVRKHPWFDRINMEQVLNKSVNPPFIPNLKSQLDVSNFDTEFTECEVDSFGDNTDMEEQNRYMDFSFDRDLEMSKHFQLLQTQGSQCQMHYD